MKNPKTLSKTVFLKGVSKEIRMKRFACFFLTFLLALGFLVRIAATTAGDYVQAPDFTLKDLSGKDISLQDLRGKVVFLNFWATWCGPCRDEIPGFVEAYSQYKDKGMSIIGISVDETGTGPVVKFAEKFRINYPVVMANNKLIKDYAPGHFIPVTVVIDKNGKIREKKIGYMNKETLIKYFLKIAEEK